VVTAIVRIKRRRRNSRLGIEEKTVCRFFGVRGGKSGGSCVLKLLQGKKGGDRGGEKREEKAEEKAMSVCRSCGG